MKNRIRLLRREKGLSQQALGERVGVSRQTISALEAGRYEPSIWLAHDIARVFGLPIEEVFLFAESPRKSRAESSRTGAKRQQREREVLL